VDEDRVVDPLEDGPHPSLGGHERLLGLDALADLGDEREEANHSAFGIPARVDEQLHRDVAAVLAAVTLDDRRPPSRQDPVVRLQRGVAELGGGQVDDRHPQQLLAGIPE